MITITRTDSTNTDFRALVKQLDADLAIRDGSDHSFYAQYNKIDNLVHVVIAYDSGKPAGCGAFKSYRPGIAEIKRMYTHPEYRGKGVAMCVLAELEHWAAEIFYEKCILETGKRQPEAIALYKKSGYTRIDNFGQYKNMENSLCFEKSLMQQG